ncbi:hypothetical protein [Pseudarthrobacter sp. PvP090]|uniref:hypothetical protein n=1 Tax=Pseudarthrobacter sp. PvP090 TaxID=3156393 RepID=UPI003390A64B
MPPSDSPWLKRVRFHQAWYRVAVLELENYGSLAGSGAGCGSVLVEADAASSMNFVGERPAREYSHRRAAGWGVDPVRCTKYMTSSQTLTFNMLSDAVSRQVECAELFGALSGRDDLERLTSYHFEYSAVGQQHFLGDRTHIDLLLEFKTKDGGTQVVAVETKLADRFSTRRTAGMHGAQYERLQEESGLWISMTASLMDNQTRQLTRCHALAQSVQQTYRPRGHATMLTLLHDDDRNGIRSAAAYGHRVAVAGSARIATWGEYLNAARAANAIPETTLSTLLKRYVDLSASEPSWVAWQQHSRSRSADNVY